MKTILRASDNISLYLLDDEEVVVIGAKNIVIGDPERMVIDDLNATNAKMVENVAFPDKFTGWKFIYDGAWSINPDWVDPSAPAQEEVL